MKKLVAALLFVSSCAWATYIPVNGSSVTVYAPNNNTTAIPVSGSFSATGSSVTIFSPNNNTIAIPVSLSGNQPINVAQTALALTTVTFNGSAQPVELHQTALALTTVTFNGTNQPVSVQGTAFNLSTVTFNGTTQPVGVQSTAFALSTVTFNGTAQPMNLSQINGTTILTGGSNGSQGVGGLAASSATAVGNPVLTGGTFSTTQPTVTEAQVVNHQMTARGGLIVATGVDPFSTNITKTAFAISTVTFNGTAQPVEVHQTALALTTVTFNGSTQPIELHQTALALTTVTFNGSAQPVNLANTAFALTTTTFNGAAQPVSIQNSTASVTGTLADNGTAAGTNRLGVLPSIYQTDYLNGTAATQGRNGAVSQGTDGLLWTAALPAMRPASYSASTNTITTAATATDIAAVCGNATNTVLVYSIRASCTQTTAGITPITIVKRSTGYSGVWSTMTSVAQDSNYIISISSAIWFTANPTPGTLVGALDNYKLGCMATGTASPNDIYISPSDWRMKPIVLRGTAQCVGINLESTTVTGGAFTATFEWIETKTISP